jgi:hypothetical protein
MREFLVGVAMLLTLCGCMDQDIGKMAKVAEKQLGVPVEVRTTNEDWCAKWELEKLAFQYRGLSESERALVKRAVQGSYKSVVIEASTAVGRVEGATYLMAIGFRGDCDQPGRDQTFCERRREVYTKQVGDTRKVVGKSPVLRVEKGDSLVIQAEEAGYAADAFHVFTEDWQLYDAITSLAQLKAYQQRGGYDLEVRKDPVPPSQCAPTVPLRDLL